VINNSVVNTTIADQTLNLGGSATGSFVSPPAGL
jgi:hypothetical protein